MGITSVDICQAAEQLEGFVGYHRKIESYIVRFSEDSFGMDVDESSITPVREFVWSAVDGAQMTLDRERLQMLINQNIDSRLGISEPLHIYLRRHDLPPIRAERLLKAG